MQQWVMCLATLGLLASSPLVMASDGNDLADKGKGKTACKKSAQLMKSSCKKEVDEEYYAVSAMCINLGDSDERKDCLKEARKTQKEDDELCGDQREARLDACKLLNEDRYDPEAFLTASDFEDNPGVTGAINPYFSLAPGHTYVSLVTGGEDDDGNPIEETVVVTVTDKLRKLLVQEDDLGMEIPGTGVNCRLVVDIVLVDGEPVEVTDDYYAQGIGDTLIGDVHYCGEVARNFEDGHLVDLDGSFEAGRDWAKSGILIKGHPVTGDAHRQEYLLGEAEDLIRYVAGVADPTFMGEGDDNAMFPCNNAGQPRCVKSEEFIPPEPEAGEYKYFIDGIGFVLGIALEDGEVSGEREELLCTGEADLSTPGSLSAVLTACGIDAGTQEDLCKLSPKAYCDD
jgi:hypothetical protein